MSRATKNPLIKKAGTVDEFTLEQIRELKKCSEDPVYFIRKYCRIQHPTRGAINFELYDYQIEMIENYHQNRYNIVLSARQTGKSTVSSMFLLWYAIFNFDKTILIASNKNKGAMEMIQRIQYAYMYLPQWLKPGVKEDGWNKHAIGFDNDSRIESTATSEDAGRGMSISLLYLDEFAFVSPTIAEEFWSAMSPTLSTGGACIISSTPNGDSNLFAFLWRQALVEANSYVAKFVPWDAPPGRDEKFKEEQIGQIGELKWKQEYECAFLSSDALLIDSIILAGITKQLEEVKPEFEVNDVVFWERPKAGVTYLVGVDPATGTGEDFTVMTVYEFPSMKQVAIFRSNTMSSAKVYPILKNLLKMLERTGSTVYFSIENNGVGEGLIALFEADETPPESAEFISEAGKDRLGVTTSGKSKIRSCLSLKELLERGTLSIKSKLLLQELKAFTRHAGSYAAQKGSTDDAVSATLIVMRILEEISTFEQQAFDTLRAVDDYKWNEGDVIRYDDYDEDDPDSAPLPMI